MLRGDFEPLNGEVGISGEEEADDDVFEGVELPEFPIANWKIDFKVPLRTGAVCGADCISVAW